MPTRTIVDKTGTLGNPGMPATGDPLPDAQNPLPATSPVRAADASQLLEYVASRGLVWVQNYLASLPRNIDDVTRDFGDDLYEQMLYDPQTSSQLNLVRRAAIDGGISVRPAEDKKDHRTFRPGILSRGPRQSSDTAWEISDSLRRCFDSLEGEQHFEEICFEMLGGLAFGNKIAEKTYRLQKGGADDGRLLLAALKPKPRRSTAFVVDAYNNVRGLLALIPGQGYPVLVQLPLVAQNGDEVVNNLLPREKFAVLHHDIRDGDPRGNSLLRAAYNAWWLKQQTWGEYLKYLTQFASPIPWAIAGPDALPQQATDPAGNPLFDTGGSPVMLSPTQQALQAIVQIRNGSGVALPNGASFGVVDMQGEGAVFLSAIDLYDRQIAKAITGQTLATDEGKHQARAASETHENTLGYSFTAAKRSLLSMLRRDIAYWHIVLNWGADYLPLMPQISLGDTEGQDVAGNLTALSHAGYSIDPSQFEGIDQDIGLPDRDPKWLEKKEQAAQEMAQATSPQDAPVDKGQAPTS